MRLYKKKYLIFLHKSIIGERLMSILQNDPMQLELNVVNHELFFIQFLFLCLLIKMNYILKF